MGKTSDRPKPSPARAAKPPRTHVGFDRERAAFGRLKAGLLETAPGRFVVLVGEEMVGPFDDFMAAYIAGRRRFGPGPLYVKQVRTEEEVSGLAGLEPCQS